MLLSVAIRYFYCSRLCIIFVSGATCLSLPRPVFAISFLVPPSGFPFSSCRPIFQANFNFDATPRWGTLRFQRGSFIYVSRLGGPLISLLVRWRSRTGGAKKITEIVATPDSRRETSGRVSPSSSITNRLVESTNEETKARRTRSSRRCAINRNTKRVSMRSRCLEGSSRMRQYFSRSCSRLARAPVSISRLL